MATKKNKNWLIYLVAIVIALVIISPLADKKIMPTAPIIEQKAHSQPKALTPIKAKQVLTEKVHVAPPVAPPYKVENHYPSQDVFDEHLCSIDRLHMDYQASLTTATQRLSNQYQHQFYQLSPNLTLNLYSVKMTTYFEETLIARINILHQEYIKLLGDSAERKIELNLVITPERTDYDYYTGFYADNLITSLGVYFGGLNIAYIDYQHSDEKALKTALHETVHAFNAHIIGKTPRMFNEGMAEFYENMTIKDDKLSLVFYTNQLTKPPYPLMQFFDYQQWANLDIHHLYYSSWAWVAFMYGDLERLNALITFIEKEQVEPCSAFSAGETYGIFQEIYSTLETDFYDWQQNISAK
ncbi:hypothetical protein NBRC116592_12810 [Colwellia sp. KU-HH00111]|uniref:hypothetical protein n=1 Tax=Colwellia sp. KU-HH00111 TaxID=3127652 RepID=UPI003106B5A9